MYQNTVEQLIKFQVDMTKQQIPSPSPVMPQAEPEYVQNMGYQQRPISQYSSLSRAEFDQPKMGYQQQPSPQVHNYEMNQSRAASKFSPEG